ncbi:MAG: alpha/beta fold hydrolase, partial [Achromobacter xylosoxidans]|nr:alpha/beta fold hydrolase [Achromobacter xylosoxidans]
MDSQRITLRAADGVALGGYAWRHAAPDPAGPRPVVVINAATSVRCRYYARFAAYLHRHGFDVLTYDYRGIGESRPASLRGFQASWMDWGEKDFEAVLGYVRSHFPGQPVDVVGHSIGGFVTGLAPSARGLRRIFTMGAQYAYWRDYAAGQRLRMLAKWHVVMPLLAACLGYFPGRRLGWLEDTPRGVVRDWSFMGPRFEGRGGPDHRVAAMA